uniref:hypothetical protein n=1 Tax=Cyathus striatus TaxID=68777 RepID=UPI0023F13172|nr:hypothetical protein P4C30_mgp33 [Cyathus striatus]WDS46388.1 hypothetical protein [Cyathus striatus]
MIFNLIFLFNKDLIINKFDKKLIKLYIKYQSLVSQISLIYLPFFILIGLFTLWKGLYWLLIHQVPYEYLDVDLHLYISTSTKNIFCLIFSTNTNYNNTKYNNNHTALRNNTFYIKNNKYKISTLNSTILNKRSFVTNTIRSE